MKTKFLSVFLLGSVLAATSVTFSSCKDYDDDIDDLQTQVTANKQQIDNILAAINGKKFISSYSATTGGYVLTFSDGETLTITNGKDGANGANGTNGTNGKDGEKGEKGDQGEQGLQGLQGPQGETGATIVPKFRVDADGYWQISVDDGETYDYVLNVAGEKVKAQGEDGAANNNVFIDDEGYINIGSERTAFKYDTTIPSIICNEKDGVLEITIDGQKYTLLLEGSAYNGLQSISFRKPYVSDAYANSYSGTYVKGYTIVDWKENEEGDWVPVYEEDENYTYVNESYGYMRYDVNAYRLQYYDKKAQKWIVFAVVPGKATFKVWPQAFSLSDAEFQFSDSYATRADAPLFTAGNATLEEGILSVDVTPNATANGIYMTSLDATMYGQYTSASDYFSVRVGNLYDAISAGHVARMSETWPQPYDLSHNNTFVYTESYNLNDSIRAYIYDWSTFPELSSVGVDYTQTFEFTKDTENGIFELKDGVLSVKKENQSSAINEWAHITVTTTVKSQVEGVADQVITNDVKIQAVREKAAPVVTTCKTIELKPLSSLALNYSEKNTQVVAFDMRSFQEAFGGRDKLMSNIASEFVSGWTTFKLAELNYNDKKEVTGYSTLYYNIEEIEFSQIASSVKASEGSVSLIYKQVDSNNTSNTEQDSLFLVVGPKTKLDPTLLYISRAGDCANDNAPLFTSGIHVTLGSELSVTRNFNAVIKDEYKSQTIIGVWKNNNTEYSLESSNFSDMYTVTPTDATLVFAVDKDKQNDYVKKAIEDGQITFENNVITFSPRLDTDQIKEVKVDLYDGSVAKDNFYRTDTWAVRSPLQAWSGTANLGKVYDPALANGSTVDVAAKAKSAWSKLVLKDYINKSVVAVESGKLVEKTSMYRTDSKSTGLKFETDTTDWKISDNGTTLTCDIDPTGSVYDKTITVTVTYTHDYGTSSFTYTIEVIRDVDPAAK